MFPYFFRSEEIPDCCVDFEICDCRLGLLTSGLDIYFYHAVVVIKGLCGMLHYKMSCKERDTIVRSLSNLVMYVFRRFLCKFDVLG